MHVITGLGLGGAEIMLARLLAALDPNRIESHVICLAPEGPVGARIRAQNVPLHVLGLRPGAKALAGLPRLASKLREIRPDVVHTWMYHADFMGGVAARLLGVPVIWALHATILEPAQTSKSTLWLVRALAAMSTFLPTRIVSCSVVGKHLHEQMGYPSARSLVIPNGFDTSEFQPSADLRRQARDAWGVSDDEIVVGHVARFHPQKDHRSLLEAAGLAHARDRRLRFVLFGTGVDQNNVELLGWAKQAGVELVCQFLGPHPRVQEVLPGFDVLVSPSRFAEAFPLVVGEAMACSVPCVVTDVGDSALMVGQTGLVVPPASARALADALFELATLPAAERALLGSQARARIEGEFSLSRVAALYTDLYEGVARDARE